MTGEEVISVFVAHPDELVRIGLRWLLEREGIRVAGEAATPAEAVGRCGASGARVLISAAWFGDGSWMDVCAEVARRAPLVRVVVLADRLDEDEVVAAVRAGATACISSRAEPGEVLRAVRAVAGGEPALDAAATRALLDHVRRAGERGRSAPLTPIDYQVVGLIAEGKTNREIAVALGISEKTVKAHLAHVFEKLNVSRRAHAAVLLYQTAAGWPGREENGRERPPRAA